ncbi:MAG: flagellar hook-length control protein FliK [Roseburia sp.]
MSTKVSEVSQLLGTRALEGSKKEQTQINNTSVQFSALLEQSAGQSTKNFGKQLSTKDVQDYAQYQRKETSIKEVKQVTLDEKVSKTEQKMSEYENAVKEVLEEELGVTEKEIERAMESLGFQYADLTNQTNLAQLVSEITGENVTDLLCNDSFVNIMQNVSALTDELLQELGMSLEEFMDICEQILYQTGNEETDPGEIQEMENTVAVSTETAQTEAQIKDSASVAEKSDEVVLTEGATSSEATANDNVEQKVAVEKEQTPGKTVMEEKTVEDTIEQIAALSEKEEDYKQPSSNQQQNQPDFTQGASAFTVQSQQSENVEVPQNTFAQNFQQTVDVQNVMEQIVQSARLTVSTEHTTMEMQLNPENLGKIFMEISSKEGIISAKLVAQNEVVREALEAQMVELKQNLNQAGVKVDAVEVTVSSHEFERNLEQNGKQEEQFAEQREQQEQSRERSRRNLNLNTLDELSGVMSEEESLVAQMMQDNGNTMDLKA